MAPYRLTQTQIEEISILWKKLAKENNGRFRRIHSTTPTAIAGADNEATRFELHIPIDSSSEFIITAGEHHTIRVNYNFQKQPKFNLKITPEDVIEKIGKLFGSQDLKVGDPTFDSKYIIKSDNIGISKSFLNKQIIKTLLDLNIYILTISNKDNNELFIMPFIRDENENGMNKLIKLTKDIILRIKSL